MRNKKNILCQQEPIKIYITTPYDWNTKSTLNEHWVNIIKLKYRSILIEFWRIRRLQYNGKYKQSNP